MAQRENEKLCIYDRRQVGENLNSKQPAHRDSRSQWKTSHLFSAGESNKASDETFILMFQCCWSYVVKKQCSLTKKIS